MLKTEVINTIKTVSGELFFSGLPIFEDPDLNSKLANEATSIASLAPMIYRNPVLYFNLLLHANKKSEKRGTQFNCGENAATYLGINHLSAFINEQNKQSADALPDPFKKILQESLLAHCLAEQFSLSRGQVNKDLKCQALIWQAPYWFLSFAHPNLVTGLKHLHHFYPWSYTQIEAKQWGGLIHERFSEYQDFNYVSDDLKSAYEHIKSKTIREQCKTFSVPERDLSDELRLWLNHDATRAYLLNLLAAAIFTPYYPRRSSKLITALAKAFHISPDKALKAVQASIYKSSQLDITGLPSADYYYLLLPSKAPFTLPNQQTSAQKHASALETQVKTTNEPLENSLEQTKPSKSASIAAKQKAIEAHKLALAKQSAAEPVKPKNAAKPSKAAAKRPNFSHPQVLVQCQQLTKSPQLQKNLNDAAKKALTFMKNTFHFDRVVLAAVNNDRSSCAAKFSLGCQNNSDLAKFKLQLVKYPVLSKFLDTPAFLEFNRLKHQKIWPKLPAFIHQETELEGFLLSSLSLRDKPNIFIYVDYGIHHWPFDADLIASYRTYVKAFGTCIRQLQKLRKQVSQNA